ncbi:hypothetical protein OS493_038712 [Desmophyllum pertusum]|uniref:Uncharacterized protein n=1 Tax=Desmophyllum pertusum TaxID=174260 RepID=A0A9X0CU81_9CNID|nr:hypothetical protein OS493_038712 [Desmophyllum pertusum]
MKKRRRGSQEDTSQHLKREDNGILCTENCARINLQRTAYSTASSIQSRVIKQRTQPRTLGRDQDQATVKEDLAVGTSVWTQSFPGGNRIKITTLLRYPTRSYKNLIRTSKNL